jgi:predicted RNA-binding protein (virulence factor B family)
VIITDESDLGVNVVINNKYLGLVYHNEFFKNVAYGDTTKGWIKAIRPNNKIDVSLQRHGHQAVHDGTDIILTALENNRGFLDLTDKSAPEEIKNRLGMSKKLFKKTIGQLYRQRVITLHEDGIRLTDGE